MNEGEVLPTICRQFAGQESRSQHTQLLYCDEFPPHTLSEEVTPHGHTNLARFVSDDGVQPLDKLVLQPLEFLVHHVVGHIRLLALP